MSKTPFPYKLVIIRREHHDWHLAHVSVLDCAENPVPGGDIGMSLIQLTQCCSASLKLTETVIQNINAAPELRDTGCQYCLIRMETGARLGIVTSTSMNSRCLVLKLANIGAAFKATVTEEVAEEKPKLSLAPLSLVQSFPSRVNFDAVRDVDMTPERLPSPFMPPMPSAGFHDFLTEEGEQHPPTHVNPARMVNDYLL
ncbi:hypothetical protein Dda_2202 [Drechslerella dactyloides]|uniref:Uncharacterized protein n=1 Tax=Drechslerella dactyloides TaxID=74499 RepID=A0AAD6NM40_DREDA|nr:hypothetical protein Dda_2202 [Drechslerella dactyloides]